MITSWHGRTLCIPSFVCVFVCVCVWIGVGVGTQWWNPRKKGLRYRVLIFFVSVFLCFCVNTLRPRQNGRHVADDIFKCIFWNENVSIAIKISLNFVPKGPINNIPALVKIMAWRRPGEKPLSEPMVISLPMHICVTRPQWVKAWVYSRREPGKTFEKMSSGPWFEKL